MRKTFICVLLANLCLVISAQVIRGTVLDEDTHEAIPYAAVYFSGTFRGTICDLEGQFKLDISGRSSQPVTVSAVGYYSFILSEIPEGESWSVFLTPKLYEIPEVAISSRSLERKRKLNMRMFRTEFLGTSYNARHCEILNEEDITFNYGSDGDTLKAYAMEPIQIRNSALGYRITYYLDQFEYDKRTRTTLFIGDIFFNEEFSDPTSSLRTIERRRRYAYQGSCMQFFRMLWTGELDSTPFRIKIPEGNYLACEDVMVKDEQGRKYFSYSRPLEIWFHSSSSYAEFLNDLVFFERTGYYDPKAILWRGAMGRQRVGDFLPYEYIED